MNNDNNVNIPDEEIATFVGTVAAEGYGVVGMASRNRFREGIAELLKKENYNKGVFIKKTRHGFSVDLYIIVAQGVKITEVVSQVQKRTAFYLKKHLGSDSNTINVYVQDIKVD